MLGLRAEQDHFGVLDDADAVAGGPVEDVASRAGVDSAVGVVDDQFAGDDVSPVRCMTGVAVEALEQRSDVGAGGEREVLAADRAVTGCVTEIGELPGGGAGDGELDGNGFLAFRWLGTISRYKRRGNWRVVIMEQSINWLPTTITGVVVSIAGYIFLRKAKKMEENYLSKERHESLCKIAHLEFKQDLAEAMKELKEDYLEGKFKSLIETIEKNGE